MKVIVLGLLSALALTQAAVVPTADLNNGYQPIVLLDPKPPVINTDNLREQFERIAPLIAPTLENLGKKVRSLDQDAVRDIKERILTSLNNIKEAKENEDVAVVIEPELPEFEAVGKDLNTIDFDPNNIVNFVDEAPEVSEQVQIVDSVPENASIVHEPEVELNDAVKFVDANAEDVVVVQEPEVPEFEAIGKDLNMIDFDPYNIVNFVNEVPEFNPELPTVREDFVHVVNPAVPFVSQIIIVGMPEQMVHQVHRFVDQVQIAEQLDVFQQQTSGKQYDSPLLR